MGAFRGVDGHISLGGILFGSPFVLGARPQGATTANIDGNGSSLFGVVMPGDRFTVAGDAQVYTIESGGVVGETIANQRSISFTPGIVPPGGWADNAAITFVTNALAQTRSWMVDVTRALLDKTVIGDAARRVTLDITQWRGECEGFLDYDDDKQAELIDAIIDGQEPTAAMALVLGANPRKSAYGDVRATNFSIVSERGALVLVRFTFEGDGALAFDWNI